MLHHIKKLFGIKPKEEVKVEEAPYKVETPAPVAEEATKAMVESIPAVKPAKKKPAAKKAAPKAPRKAKSKPQA